MTATTTTRTRQNKIFYEKRKSSARVFNNLYISAPSAKYQHTQICVVWEQENRPRIVYVSVLNSIGWRRRRERDKTKYFTRREKALHVHLTICISQRPRRNINIRSYPNLRGLRIRKPTTSCLCFCFKLNRVKNATKKRIPRAEKNWAKAPHIC